MTASGVAELGEPGAARLAPIPMRVAAFVSTIHQHDSRVGIGHPAKSPARAATAAGRGDKYAPSRLALLAHVEKANTSPTSASLDPLTDSRGSGSVALPKALGRAGRHVYDTRLGRGSRRRP